MIYVLYTVFIIFFCVVFFFFKQKTSYEMRISDWSSDVCSSDLDGSVGFLDWQVVRRGCWSQDVGYFLVGALTQDDRREHERALLKIYADALEVPIATCPSPDALWLHYRASAAYGLAIWLSTLGTEDRKSTRLNSSHSCAHRMPTSA